MEKIKLVLDDLMEGFGLERMDVNDYKVKQQEQLQSSLQFKPQIMEPTVVEPQAVEPQTVEPQAIEPQAVEPQTT